MIRVASYCRVSTDHEDQANSFEAQQRYFRQYIDRQPDWELYQVYADEGISGTSTKKRNQFNRMISDAHMGKFKLIITKEVSRFSRNILDTIGYTRELKALGVGVIFMNDSIDTRDPDAELRLSIMGSIAQEESRKTSTRVKWGQTRQMERGVVFGRSLLGYDVMDGKMTVNLEGAELVRLIFHKYGVEKKGTSVIARELREAGFLTYRGNPKWSNSHIVKILKNEKYVGDLVQKKTYTPDYLTHEKRYNHGEEEFVTLENHHEAIVERDLWNIVQSEMKKRNPHGQLGAGHSNRYVLSGKIKCGLCGYSFVSRKKQRKDGSFYRRWSCFTAANEGTAHTDPQGNLVGCNIGLLLREDFAMDCLQMALDGLRDNHKAYIKSVAAVAQQYLTIAEQGGDETEEQLTYQMQTITQRKEDALDAFFAGTITKEEMRLMNGRYDKELTQLQSRLSAVRERDKLSYETATLQADIKRHISDILRTKDPDEVFYKNILERIVVDPERHLTIKLNLLPPKWKYVLDSVCDIRRQLQEQSFRSHFDPFPPISVSSPFSSGYGME